jgi:hypothetical protein
MVKKLDEELEKAYKVKGLQDKMEVFYSLGAQRDAAELSLKELKIKYTKLEAKCFEQEKDSRHLKEEINNIKKDNELKEKLITSFKERVRKSDLNILTQTLRTIRYKMTVKRQLCMLLKIIVFQSRRKTLKLMKAAGEKKNDDLNKPDGNSDLLQTIWRTVNQIREEQSDFFLKSKLKELELVNAVEAVKFQTAGKINEINEKLNQDLPEKVIAELKNQEFKIEIIDKLKSNEKRLQNIEDFVDIKTFSKNENEMVESEIIKKVTGGFGKKNNKKREEKKPKIDGIAIIQENRREIKELNIIVSEMKSKIEGERENRTFLKKQTKVPEVKAYAHSNLINWGMFEPIVKRETNDHTITSLLRDIETTISEHPKLLREQTVQPRQIEIAWDLILKDSVYEKYKNDWKVKSYLSPVFRRKFDSRMTPNEWEWQTNKNRILISCG